jgi:hypothetical protein
LTTFRAISHCDAPLADPEPAVNRALAAEMRKVYSSCGISAMLALMISPIGSIPICEASCEHEHRDHGRAGGGQHGRSRQRSGGNPRGGGDYAEPQYGWPVLSWFNSGKRPGKAAGRPWAVPRVEVVGPYRWPCGGHRWPWVAIGGPVLRSGRKWPFGPPHEPPRRSGRDCRRSSNRAVGCRSRASPTVRPGGG